MLKRIRRPIGPGGARRGVTLVEMLVVVALVVLMMVILVQIFQSATGAMSASRTVQELDVNLRQVDSILRSDLAGTTACMTPTSGQNNPKNKRGYFVYGENAFADAQGEDTDDYLAFTTRAPEGQVFSGRQWLAPTATPPYVNQGIQPTTINSQVAEIIYFLRNGNLYRRVFLVVPERVNTIKIGTISGGGYASALFGGTTRVSWQGVNDISCRPAGYNGVGINNVPIPNDLGTLTNRENRSFHPRFPNDFTGGAGGGGDGVPDDNNGDGVPDYYPTLYTDGSGSHGNRPNGFVNDVLPFTGLTRLDPTSYSIYAFPFIYPGMYSVPDTDRINLANNLGWVHGLYPATDAVTKNLVLNHGPLDVGDNLLAPIGKQVWWGFPTWRETMTGNRPAVGAVPASIGWTDPVFFVGSGNGLTQPNGLIPYSPTTLPTANPANLANLLPPITVAETGNAPFMADTAAGSSSFVAIPSNPKRVWEDDLLLSGVRSFDVKAYDPNAPLYNFPANGPFSAGYHDLGYGANSYVAGLSSMTFNGMTVQATPPAGVPFFQTTNADGTSNPPQGFGHEGRIPPIPSDFRYHPRRSFFYDTAGKLNPYNIGDANRGVIRLTRVWDSWSTDYTNAPDSDFFLHGLSNTAPALYPSFPPPYPSALRGIQIQIRLVDPRGEKAKSITIRHDFTDKL